MLFLPPIVLAYILLTNPIRRCNLRTELRRGRFVASNANTDDDRPVDATKIPALPSQQQEPTARKRKVAILVCPAQFCVPDDYRSLFENLENVMDLPVEISKSSCVVPLGRTDWIKVARQLPTKSFLDASLDVKTTLDWYFRAIDEGLSNIFAAEGENVNICFVGHSIGGWVARAYLGGMSQSSTACYRLVSQQCTSLITLGTPHSSPKVALVDQTRGLLQAIEQTPTCSSRYLAEERGISITCVCSDGIKSELSSFNPENFIALASYLPLTGSWQEVRGDGIVPSSLAFLEEPAERVVLEKCTNTGKAIRHSHCVPTPWNLWDPRAASISLPPEDYPSYITPGVVSQWARFIQ